MSHLCQNTLKAPISHFPHTGLQLHYTASLISAFGKIKVLELH